MSWNVGLASDNEALQYLFERTFEGRNDVSVTFYTTAEDLIGAIPNSPPDLLIISVSLPDKDGYDLCQELKEEKKVTFPILLIEDIFEDIDLDRCLEAHTDGFIAKPFEEDLIAEKVDEVLQTLKKEPKEEKKPLEEVDGELQEAPVSLEEESPVSTVFSSDEEDDILELTDLVAEEEVVALEEATGEEAREVPPSIASALEESVSELEKMEAMEEEKRPSLAEEEREVPAVSPAFEETHVEMPSRQNLEVLIQEVVERVVAQTIQKSLEENLPGILRENLSKLFSDIAKSFK